MKLNYNFYNGLVMFKTSRYSRAIRSFEQLLIKPSVKNILSPIQTKQMLTGYIESLYQSNDQKRFRKNASALVNDLRRSVKTKYTEMLERIEYLYIESLFGEKLVNYKLLAVKLNEFKADHKKSSYMDRVSYLDGLALLNTSKVASGKKVLEELLNREETPDYLKGLARSELATLAIENNTL